MAKSEKRRWVQIAKERGRLGFEEVKVYWLVRKPQPHNAHTTIRLTTFEVLYPDVKLERGAEPIEIGPTSRLTD